MCSIACHGGTNQDNACDCIKILSIFIRTQRSDRVRNKEVNKEVKRQRRNIAKRYAANKGNDLVECNDMAGNDDDMDGKSGSKGGRKGAKK